MFVAPLKMFVAPLGILVLLIIPALLVGIIVLIIKGGPAVRWFFGILLLLLIIGFFGLFSMKTVPRPVEVVHSVQPDVQIYKTLHVVKDPIVWRDGLEEELTPDIYSSLETAAYGLGIQLYDTIQIALNKEPLKKIVIKELNVTFPVCEQLRRGLSNIYEDIPIVINQDTFSPSAGEIHIELKTNISTNSKTLNFESGTSYSMLMDISNPQGTLSAIVLTGNNKHLKEVKFNHCIWLYDSELFRSQVEIGQWATIASSETAITKEQARQQVIDNACSYLTEQLEIQGIAKEVVTEADLKNHGFVADEYDQRLQGVSGPIWRAALLLDVSPERIQMLRQNKIVSNRNMKRSWMFQVLSLIAMLVLISVLYLFVNTITKGYYSTTIFIIAAIAFLVFLFLFLA